MNYTELKNYYLTNKSIFSDKQQAEIAGLFRDYASFNNNLRYFVRLIQDWEDASGGNFDDLVQKYETDLAYLATC